MGSRGDKVFIFRVFLGATSEKYKMSQTYKGKVRIKGDKSVSCVMIGERGDILSTVCGDVVDGKVRFTLDNDVSFLLSFEKVGNPNLPFSSWMIGRYGNDSFDDSAVAVYE